MTFSWTISGLGLKKWSAVKVEVAFNEVFGGAGRRSFIGVVVFSGILLLLRVNIKATESGSGGGGLDGGGGGVDRNGDSPCRLLSI